ncbi:glycosyltransferase family 2 protein [Candidatus Fermentibacteria bacterium]|nr:MAG: glycosyltransferase family 2 protein [Candidatus Fermentibacteria bacterium]
MFKVSVVVPAFNESQSVEHTIHSIQELFAKSEIEGEIVLVDDGSTDDTAALAQSAGAMVVSHPGNLGYGAALKTGIVKARFDTVVITDADGTYPIDMIPVLLSRMQETGADMVVGSRTGIDVAVPVIRKPFKWVVRRLAQYIVEKPIPDLNSGLRVFKKDMALRYHRLYPNGFSFTSTITVASMCDSFNVEYVPINYYHRAGKSKIVPVDFFAFVMLVLRLSVLFKPLRVFVPVAVFCFSVGFLKLIHDVIMAVSIAGSTGTSLLVMPVVSSTAIAFLLASLQILLVGMVAEALAKRGFVADSMVERKN